MEAAIEQLLSEGSVETAVHQVDTAPPEQAAKTMSSIEKLLAMKRKAPESDLDLDLWGGDSDQSDGDSPNTTLGGSSDPIVL